MLCFRFAPDDIRQLRELLDAFGKKPEEDKDVIETPPVVSSSTAEERANMAKIRNTHDYHLLKSR